MEIATLDTSELKGEVVSKIEAIKNLTITTHEDAQKATDFRGVLKGLEKKIKEFFSPHVKRAYDAHKALVGDEKAHLNPVTEAIGIIDQKVYTFQEEQRRIAEAEQRRLEEEARKRAEEEQLAEAEAAEKAGDHAAAEQIVSAPTVVAPVLAPARPKLQGAAVVKYYGARIDDIKKLVKAVADGKAPLEAILPNETFLNMGARIKKAEGAELYPGVTIIAKGGLRG